MRTPTSAGCGLLLLGFAAGASAAVGLVTVASGLSQPTYVTHAGDASGRRFIVEQSGVIRVRQPGSSTPTTFLDIHTIVLSPASGGDNEQGLASVAFPPNYASNGQLYVYYTDMSGNNNVAQYTAAPANANTVNPATGTVLLTIPHPGQTNHNGGQLNFGPDGCLYVSVGDGGGAGDPARTAQDLTDLRGKLLRPTAPGLAADRRCLAGSPLYHREPLAPELARRRGGAEEAMAHQEYSLGGAAFDERRYAARYLAGIGIEIGPGHLPIPVDPKVCTVKYVDRLTEAQMRTRFPELAEAALVRSDILCDVAQSGLCCRDASLDFVIASHLLEHSPNPLGLFQECHRVLRDSGILYLGVPDKTYTFDRDRASTPLDRLVGYLERGVTEPDEASLVDYITHAAKVAIPEDPDARRRLFEHELARSFHVHVWTWEEAVELVRYMIVERGTAFELLDLYLPKGVKNEVVLVLQRRPLTPAEAGRRFESALSVLIQRESAMAAAIQAEAAQAAEIARLRGSAAVTPYARVRDALFPPGTRRRRLLGRLRRRLGRPASRGTG